MPVYTYKHNEQNHTVAGPDFGQTIDFLATQLDVDQQLIHLEHFTIPVIVVAENSEGAPELVRCDIQVTHDQYENGDHYDMAKSEVEDNGYSALAVFDYFDPAYRDMVAYRDEHLAPEIIKNA